MEAVRRREILRLLMELPPNTLKSTIISVCYPAWVWVDQPSERFLFSANDGPLASRDAGFMRELIESRWYQSSFRPSWRLKEDQDEKTWFANTKGGHRISYSIGAKVTGKKGDQLFVDDPHDAKKVYSQANRESVKEWHDQAFSGRFADERSSPEVVTGQRTHKDDLFGHLRRQGGWECCRLDEEFNPSDVAETSIWKDPRTKAGEWLRPERFGPKEKKYAISRMGTRGYTTQHNLRPQDVQGNVFHRAWFPVVSAAPSTAKRVRFWDKAHTEDGGCYTAGVLLCRSDAGLWFVENVVREQHSALLREQLIKQVTQLDESKYGHVTTVVEQEPAGGKESAERTIRMLSGYDVHAVPPSGDKVVRALGFAAQAEAGNVFIVEDDRWNNDYLDELASFPDAQYADQVDASSGAFNWISKESPLSDGELEAPRQTRQGGILDDLRADTFR